MQLYSDSLSLILEAFLKVCRAKCALKENRIAEKELRDTLKSLLDFIQTISCALEVKVLYTLIAEHLSFIQDVITSRDDIELDLILLHFLYEMRNVFFPKKDPMFIFEVPLAMELYILVSAMNLITYENQINAISLANFTLSYLTQPIFSEINTLSE